MLTKLTRHGQITLPKAVRERLHLVEGDYVDVQISDDDRGVFLRPRKMVAIDPDQEWFWTAEWQAAARAAEEDLVHGRVVASRPGETASDALRRAAAATDDKNSHENTDNKTDNKTGGHA